MTDPKHHPRTQLHGIRESGSYEIVLRFDDRDERVTAREHIDEAFADEQDVWPRIVLHRPRHVFVRPAELGARYQVTPAGATIDLAGTTVTVIDVEEIDGLPGVVEARLLDDGPDAYAVATHPSLLPSEGGLPGVTVVHGYRSWNHIAWFNDEDLVGPAADFPNAPNGLQAPPQFGNPPPEPVQIGLLDTGVDTRHAWFADGHVTPISMPGEPTSHEYPAHGTMVAGVLRQAAPRATVLSVDVSMGVENVHDERMIVRGLNKLQRRDCWLAVMAFGGEHLAVFEGPNPLEQRIDLFTGFGGKVFAAAGNLHTLSDRGGKPPRREAVYPAAYANVAAIAGSPDDDHYYGWSNGWGSKRWKPMKKPNPDQTLSVTDDDRSDGFLYTSYGMSDDGQTSLYATARGTSLLTAIAAGIAAGGETPFPGRV